MKRNSLIVVETEDGERATFKVKQGAFFRTYEGMKKFPICCFVFLNIFEDFYKDGEEYQLKEEVADNLIKQFKGRDMLFIDPIEFFDRLDISIKEEGFGYKRSWVQYYEEQLETHPIASEKYDENPFHALFYKRKFFEFQKEYRVIIHSMLDKNTVINIGDIGDITTVFKPEYLYNLRIRLENK